LATSILEPPIKWSQNGQQAFRVTFRNGRAEVNWIAGQ
jgi:hypothetical protein